MDAADTARPSTPGAVITKVFEDWTDKVVFRMPSGFEDEDLMLDFVNQHFVPYEPLNVSVTMCEIGYRMPWFDNFCRGFIREGHSLMAIDSEENELVGLSITHECRPDQDDCHQEQDVQRWAKMPEKFGKVLSFLEGLTEPVNVFSSYNCDRYLELFILTTHSTHRYPGLGTETARHTMALAKRHGFGHCVTEATSLYSQKVFARLNFETVAERRYDDYRVGGKVVFPRHGPHDSAKFMVKIL